jgi:hypothetical protein
MDPRFTTVYDYNLKFALGPSSKLILPSYAIHNRNPRGCCYPEPGYRPKRFSPYDLEGNKYVLQPVNFDGFGGFIGPLPDPRDFSPR